MLPNLASLDSMSVVATHLRRRAAECRQLAANARDARDCAYLRDIAEELDAEADRVEAGEGKLR